MKLNTLNKLPLNDTLSHLRKPRPVLGGTYLSLKQTKELRVQH